MHERIVGSSYRGIQSKSVALSFISKFVQSSHALIRIHARHVGVFRISGLARIAFDSL